MSESLYALGIGVGTRNSAGEWLEVFYPAPMLHPPRALGDALRGSELAATAVTALDAGALDALGRLCADSGASELGSLCESLAGSGPSAVLVTLAGDEPPLSVPEAYLKLQLISHRLVKPHETDLAGVFAVLPNVAWTSEGAVDIRELPARQLAARLEGRVLEVHSVDKFPKMTDYVVPGGVRIADTARVRLGAYVGEGTTVMHEGFINFNAGTEGPNMVEGRISAGVTVGSGSDLGGGCSTMGTLSGGGDIVIAVGKDCLLGANAGLGIPLGDRCTVEAGLYITAGTRVNLLDENGDGVSTVKARELAGQSDLLFRRNSLSGAVECLANRSAVELNQALHAHN
jgi:2,3,4,5-tetrahydropyridine-2-carboxylate N-succinyltransferase